MQRKKVENETSWLANGIYIADTLRPQSLFCRSPPFLPTSSLSLAWFNLANRKFSVRQLSDIFQLQFETLVSKHYNINNHMKRGLILCLCIDMEQLIFRFDFIHRTICKSFSPRRNGVATQEPAISKKLKFLLVCLFYFGGMAFHCCQGLFDIGLSYIKVINGANKNRENSRKRRKRRKGRRG